MASRTPPAPIGIDSVIARIVPGVFGLIGITVLVFLWSAPFGAWDSPPLFFRIFGSLIAVVFVAIGFRGALGPSILKSRGRHAEQSEDPLVRGSSQNEPEPKIGYDCPNCGAGLGPDADVSPSGDVKCTFCNRWFNIHQAG